MHRQIVPGIPQQKKKEKKRKRKIKGKGKGKERKEKKMIFFSCVLCSPLMLKEKKEKVAILIFAFRLETTHKFVKTGTNN